MDSSALLLVWLFLWSGASVAQPSTDVPSLAGQDLHVRCPEMTVYTTPASPWDQIIGFSGGVAVTVGDNQLSGKEGFLWLKLHGSPSSMLSERYFQAYLYLEGNVQIEQGPRSKTTAMRQATVQGANALATQFLVTGDVFAESPKRTEAPYNVLPSEPLYQRGLSTLTPLAFGPDIPQEARVPLRPHTGIAPLTESPAVGPTESPAGQTPAGQTLTVRPSPPIPVSPYPVHVSSVWEPTSKIEKTVLADGQEVIIASGRFYLWQQQSADRMIEFMADSVVLYLEPGQFDMARQQRGNELGSGAVRRVYLSGNIVFTESDRTVRADEVLYDFRNQRALIVNASMRVYDEKRGIPIYLRAEKLGRVSETLFEAKNVQLTSSEFYLPQVSLNASRMILLTEEQSVEQRDAVAQDSARAYDAQLYDVNARYKNFTFFRWPKIRTGFVRPDTPLSRIRVGDDSDYGTFLETRWHLARLLGWKEPPGVDSRLALDYFSDRGYGTGVDAKYETDDAYGTMIAYIMRDRGRDDLGRTSDRRNLEPDNSTRGRFSFRHRQYLPDDWQLTVETSYISDENFLEWMYRDEFYADKSQETLVYLKRVWDNQGFSILNKVRINDFETMTEELPTIEYHRTGQSFWDHNLTWYSDTQVSRLRQRYKDGVPHGPRDVEGFYSYATTRNEVDSPLMVGSVKVVPFVAGTYGYEDRLGYDLDLNGNRRGREDNVFLGETGVRGSTMFWKEDPTVQSAFWNVQGLRHIVTPYFEAAAYQPSDASIDMRDYVHLGANQRWQTHRGSERTVQTVDWMRLDVNGTWVRDAADSAIGPVNTYGPSWFVYNDPSIPFLQRRDSRYYGIARNSFNGEYEWRVSETFTLLSDANYDLQSGHLQQFNIGMSRYVHPDISYYVGSRYLRPLIVQVDENGDGIIDVDELGSHSVVGAITWHLSSRYTATFSQEYNFDFGGSVRSDLTIVRQYHRMFYAVSFSIDESLKRNMVMLSVWPQGVDQLGFGSGRYSGLTGAVREE